MTISKDLLRRIRPRFEARFKQDDPSICWPWRGSVVTRGGYGLYAVRIDGKHTALKAHRLALAYSLGYWPKQNVFACHRCDNPICVNPFHIYAGTAQQNVDDMYVRGRANPRMKGCQGPLRQLSASAAMSSLNLYFGRYGQGTITLLRLHPRNITFAFLMRRFGQSETSLRNWLHLSGVKHVYLQAQAKEARILWFSKGAQGFYAKKGSREAQWTISTIAQKHGVTRTLIKALILRRTYAEVWRLFLNTRPGLAEYMKTHNANGINNADRPSEIHGLVRRTLNLSMPLP